MAYDSKHFEDMLSHVDYGPAREERFRTLNQAVRPAKASSTGRNIGEHQMDLSTKPCWAHPWLPRPVRLTRGAAPAYTGEPVSRSPASANDRRTMPSRALRNHVYDVHEPLKGGIPPSSKIIRRGTGRSGIY